MRVVGIFRDPEFLELQQLFPLSLDTKEIKPVRIIKGIVRIQHVGIFKTLTFPHKVSCVLKHFKPRAGFALEGAGFAITHLNGVEAAFGMRHQDGGAPIGCGKGGFIIQLAQTFQNTEFVGVDPIIHGIEMGKTKTKELGIDKRVSFQHLGGEDLPYDNEFEIVSMVLTLHEILPVAPEAN